MLRSPSCVPDAAGSPEVDAKPSRRSARVSSLCVIALCSALGACNGVVEAATEAGGAPGAAGPGAGSGPMGSGAGAAGGAPSGAAGATSASGQGGLGAGGSAGSVAGGGRGPVVVDPPPFSPAPGLLRRLTRAQFRNAVRDVFGVEVNVQDLDADSWNGSFATVGASTVVTAERGVEQYHAAIEAAVDSVFADATKRAALVGCTPSGSGDDACLRGFVTALGRRAWRRPLEAVEIERVAGVGATAASELGDAFDAARFATLALFVSPNFLYRPELGAAHPSGSLRFTGYELASRLAFLAWNSLPDVTLLDQAASGALDSADGLRAAATRLLDDPRGREAVGAFAEEYFRLDRVATLGKDPALFPEYGAALKAAMIRDMRGTWEAIAFDDRASALELFTTTKVVANAELAQLYGLDASGLDSSTYRTFSLPADGPRLGILGKAGFLAQFANQKEGSPTLRGKFMREALMCTPIQPPPGNVDVVLDEPPADQPMTKRQRLEVHRTNPTCGGCHSLMDPLGLPLETFDAIGRFRTTDRGLMIDPSGDFDETFVADARELGFAVAASKTVIDCLVRKYYSYATGHVEREADGTVLNALAAAFEASGFQLRDLIVELVTHDAFASVAPQP